MLLAAARVAGSFTGKALGKAATGWPTPCSVAALARAAARRRHALRGEKPTMPPGWAASRGVDRRSARRHARIWRGRAATGRCMSRWRSTAWRRSARWRCRALGLTLAGDRHSAGPSRRRRPRMLVSRTRPAAEAHAVAEAARRRAGADGLGRRQGDGGRARRGRHLPPFGRAIRMGQLRAGRGRAGRTGCTARGSMASPLRYNQESPTCRTC